MIHLDIKSLGRIARPSHRVTGNRRDSVEGIGWEHLHVAINDCSRLAYTEVLDGLGSEQATAFLQRALDWFGRLGVRVERVMTDNGSAYRSKLFAQALEAAGMRQHARVTNADRVIEESLQAEPARVTHLVAPDEDGNDFSEDAEEPDIGGAEPSQRGGSSSR